MISKKLTAVLLVALLFLSQLSFVKAHEGEDHDHDHVHTTEGEEEVQFEIDADELAAEEGYDEAEMAARLSSAFAQQQSQQFLSSSPEIATAYVIPEFQDRKIEAGSVVDVVLGFSNNGEQQYVIQYMRGFLVNPNNFDSYIQNYTTYRYNVSVPAGEEASALYRFRPDPFLEPREYGLKLEVFYFDAANRSYANTWFNETITILEPPSQLDARAIFSYAAIFAVIGLCGYLVFTAIAKRGSKGGSSSAASNMSAKEIKNSYITAAHHNVARRRPTTPSKKD